MDDFLEKSLERMNGWLQFAEAKHAALIAFLVAILAVLYGGDFVSNAIFKMIIAIIYLIALIISIYSFYPKGHMRASESNGSYGNNDNLLFWKDVAKYSVEDFLKKVYKDFMGKDRTSFEERELLYAYEIIDNARIAKRKYELFENAVKVTIFGTILIPIFLIIIA